jgi:hypothetical protein
LKCRHPLPLNHELSKFSWANSMIWVFQAHQCHFQLDFKHRFNSICSNLHENHQI